MERLRKKDADAGIEERAVSDEQKAALTEVRSMYDAQLAQVQVMHESAMRQSMDPAERAELEVNHRRDRERVISARDAKLAELRRGESASS